MSEQVKQQRQYDVLIVGGGPAGLSAAKSAALEGVSTLLLEKSREIGYPVKTSGGSFIPDLRKLGIPESLYHPIRRIRLISNKATATFEYTKPIFCVLDTRGLWQYLAREAAAAGATLLCGCRVLGPVLSGGEVRGVEYVTGDGKKATVTAAITVDASGISAVIGKAAGLHRGFKRYGIGTEFEIFAPEYDTDEATLAYGSRFAPSGYAWIFPRGGSKVRLGVGIIHPDTSEDSYRLAQDFLEWLRDSLVPSTSWSVLEIHSGVVPSENARGTVVGPRLAAAGDSAGHASCLTGEGIRFAIAAGRMAGRAAALAASGNAQRQLLRYQKQWFRRQGDMYSDAYRINRILSELSDDQWDEYVELANSLSPSEFAELLHGDFRQVARRLARTPLRAIGLLGAARSLLSHADEPQA